MKNGIFKLVCFIACIVAIFIYRLVLVVKYSSVNIDEDSACMWYGVEAFRHFALLEPHFIGQKTLSMLEAALALPLYLIKIPINYALPISASIFWFVPF